ncbi:hypothetical protein K3495_g4110 [Podosphaera aphanis]|nr:hypothetical protein K3495_g4110 [Podosphaera aphanis]
MEPSEESIRLFVEMAPGLSRDEVIQRIKSNSNNVEQAINEYYDYPDTTKYSWEKPSFRVEPNVSPNHLGTTYGAQGVDVPDPFHQFSVAPSRPPSRANHTSFGPSMNDDDQDPELTKALALSAQEAGISQDRSVQNSTPVYFGPATREVYNSSQWSMVPLGKSAESELECEASAVNRIREPGTPAFLRPSGESHGLGALITIYHQIPMMRNIFLNNTDILSTYGYDKEWWNGKSINSSEIDVEERFVSVGRELQRLMAFLDNTERSYGSVEALTSLLSVNTVREYVQVQESEDIYSNLLEAWRKIHQENNPGAINQIFSVGVATEETEQDEQRFAILKLLPPNNSFYENLYDICDECLWPDFYPVDLPGSPYLSHVAEIFTFKLETSRAKKNIDIPAVWYPDRYMKPSREASLEMRIKKREILEQMELIANMEDRLTNVKLRNGKSFTVKHMFDTCIKHDEASLADLVQSNEEGREIIANHSTAAVNLSAEIRKLVANVDRKLIDLDKKKKTLYTQFRQLSTLHTCQPTSPTAKRLKSYSLRGVCTRDDIMYVCQRLESPHSLDTTSDDLGAPLDQWWQIIYASPSIYSLERTTIDEVLAAAKQESKSPLLVYASEKALTAHKMALPKPLERFVHWDNSIFKNELQIDRAKTEDELAEAVHQHRSDLSPGTSSNNSAQHHSVDVLDFSRSVETKNKEDLSEVGRYNNRYLDQNTENLIVGIDPSLIQQTDNENELPQKTTQEMVERSSLLKNSWKRETLDGMDLDSEVPGEFREATN